MMKVLVIGGGGREHALVHTFNRQGHAVYCLPGNAGIASLCQPLPAKWSAIDSSDFEALADFVEEEGIELTVCGPEEPLEKGVANVFLSRGLHFFGPTKEASVVECQKAWSKRFMHQHLIPTARSVVCTSGREARLAASKFFYDWGGMVVKPSGLTAGKGVVVCDTLKEVEEAISEIMEQKRYGDAGKMVVLEEKLHGKEVSIMAFCDGKSIVPMISSQDHKRLHDGGQGVNTGGMGAYSPTPFLCERTMEAIESQVIERTLRGFKMEGMHYVGFLYFGLMLTENGPSLLEYNCRFGDPEAQTILPLLKSDLAEILLSCCKGTLSKETISWSDDAACTVVMVSRGYPRAYKTGFPITGLETAEALPNTTVFHFATVRDGEGNILTNGGRVLGVTSVAPTLQEAIDRSYKAVDAIHFENSYHRIDIGSAGSIEKETAELTATI